MPEERVCFICGRPNPRNSRVCANCAVAYDMERPFAPEEAATAETSALQLKSESAPAAPSRVPLPPQLRAVEEKRVAEAAPRPVRLETPAAATVEAPARTEEKTKSLTCGACGEETNPAFSFCTHCGADLPGAKAHAAAPAPRASVRAADLPQGIRDTRTAMRRIAEVHRQQEAAAHQQTQARPQEQRQQTRTEAIVIDTKREVNPTVNAALSFFFPGVGQMLNGQVGKGVLLLVGSIIAVQLMKFSPYGLPMLIAGVLAAVDAYRIGERRRKGERVESGEWDFS